MSGRPHGEDYSISVFLSCFSLTYRQKWFSVTVRTRVKCIGTRVSNRRTTVTEYRRSASACQGSGCGSVSANDKNRSKGRSSEGIRVLEPEGRVGPVQGSSSGLRLCFSHWNQNPNAKKRVKYFGLDEGLSSGARNAASIGPRPVGVQVAFRVPIVGAQKSRD